jgi:hypothetical protein
VAQRIQTLFIDDIDGSEAEGTVRFGLDGAEYEIDLSSGHAQELRAALARYVQARQARSRCTPACAEQAPGRYQHQRAGQHPGPGPGEVAGH